VTGLLEGFRWALVGGPWPGSDLVTSVAGISVLLVGGLVYFRRAEPSFADVI
jgi:hypothetical protein